MDGRWYCSSIMSYQPLVVCPRCARHIRASELQCPFCGKMKSGAGNLRGVFVGTVLAATVAGCSPQPEAVSPYAPPPYTEEDAAVGEDESVDVIAEEPDGGLSGGPEDVVPVPAYAPVPVDVSPVPAYAAVPPVDEP